MKNNAALSGYPVRVEEGQGGRCTTEHTWVWLLAGLPLVIVCGLFFSLLLSGGALSKFGEGFEGTRDALCFLLLVSLPALAAAIEIDVRLKCLGSPIAEGARGLLGCSSFLAFVLFLVWAAEAMADSKSHEAGFEFLLCVLIVGTCGPLLWSAAGQLARTEHRLALLGGHVIATIALELAFDESNQDAEERFFLYQSVPVALAVALRLGVWGWREFNQPPPNTFGLRRPR